MVELPCEAAAWMMTVRVEVALRPEVSVAKELFHVTDFGREGVVMWLG